MMILSYASQEANSSSASDTVSFDLPEGVSLSQALSMMGDAEREKMLQQIDKKIKDIPDTIVCLLYTS